MVYFENCFLVPEFIPIGMGFRFHLCTVPDLNKVPAGVNRIFEDPVCTCNLYHCSFLLSEPTLQAKRNPRVLESVSDASKLYPHHLVLLSEGFMEGRMALRSAVVTSNVVAPPGVSAKLEQTIPTTSQAPAISGRSSSVNTSKITIVALFMLCMLRIFVGILFGLLQQTQSCVNGQTCGHLGLSLRLNVWTTIYIYIYIYWGMVVRCCNLSTCHTSSYLGCKCEGL